MNLEELRGTKERGGERGRGCGLMESEMGWDGRQRQERTGEPE